MLKAFRETGATCCRHLFLSLHIPDFPLELHFTRIMNLNVRVRCKSGMEEFQPMGIIFLI